jgi:hypothetical protein
VELLLITPICGWTDVLHNGENETTPMQQNVTRQIGQSFEN